MNDDLKNNQTPNDEVDLGQLFNAIGRLFDRFFKFIAGIILAIFGFVVFILKVIIDNFKTIFVVVLAAFILGFTMQKMKPRVFASQMLVKPYFDSKYQLINNVGYFNSLIAIGNTEELSQIFEISESSAEALKSFEVKPGPESDNEKAMAYNEFLESIDTLSAKTFTYNEFIENRDIYSGELFEINVESTERDIFKSLEPGLNNSFKNTYSIRQKEKHDTVLEIQKLNIMASLASIDSLRKVYIKVLEEDAKRGSTKISFGQGLSLEPENNSKTKEFELLNREIEFRTKLLDIEEMKVKQDTFFDVVSGFQNVGNKTSKFGRNYILLFPLIALVLMIIIFMLSRTVKFVREYKR